MKSQPHHNVYVIELNPAVLEDRRFAAENPDHLPGKACLYVGMTGRTPKERFEQHKKGIKACRHVKKHGLWLRPRLFQKYNPMSYEQAVAMEKQLAMQLRQKGYAVWQR